MGRRSAATYIFHLGQIQLPRKGRDGKIQHYGASKPNDTTHEVTKWNAIPNYNHNPGQNSWDANAIARQIEASSLPPSPSVQCWRYAFKFGRDGKIQHYGASKPPGGGGGTMDFKRRGWSNGAKSQDPKKSLGLPAKPKKIPGPKINPQKIPCRFCGP